MMTNRILYILCALTLVVCAGCSAGGDEPGTPPYGNSPSETAMFEGSWSVGHDTFAGQMEVLPTGFRFYGVPTAAILASVLPDRTIGTPDGTTFMVSYVLAGEAGNALRYMLGDSEWRTTVTVDGVEKDVRMGFSSLPAYTGITGSTATYSRLSGMYMVVMQMTSCVITSPDTGQAETIVPMGKLTFVTTKRIL